MDKYRHDNSWAKNWVWEYGYIRSLVAVSLSLQPLFNGLKMKLYVCHAPLLARFFFSVISMVTKHLPRPLDFFSIISIDWKWNQTSVDKISSALFYRLKMNLCHAPSTILRGFKSQSRIYVEADSPLIQQLHNTHCIETKQTVIPSFLVSVLLSIPTSIFKFINF